MATGTNGIPTIGELRELFPEADIPTGQPDNKCVLINYCAMDQSTGDIDNQYSIPFIHIPYILEGNYTDYKLNQLAKFSDIRFIFDTLNWYTYEYDGYSLGITILHKPKSTIYLTVEIYGTIGNVVKEVEITPSTDFVSVDAWYQTIGTPSEYLIYINNNSPQYDDYYFYRY